ncbi:hypothetical protein [Thermodesulforhabdus norvegica]|uniref:Uncharacterized protein n=1 Tax=Thermodesulforhabdus norvegica TaxID=39841 RepID=A0A1I4UL27_9BACT|nr:hypothetical protein [Thermodesulforhabdus norvegica]SFM89621.1 hypothetical protein SAMN05660836_01856 [Thermodesulforhabdus norvegica]
MEERREVCVCENCGNEAEMIIRCSYVRVDDSGEEVRKKEVRTCSICGNEADLIID